MKRIVALAGGVGAARFLDGLARVVAPERLLIVGNTADDSEIQGLHISPDLDTVMYTLAGLADPKRGWGVRGDTFRCLQALGRLGGETWFQLGDRDLATHLYRTRRLREGAELAAVTAELAAALGVRASIVPMTNDRVRTRVCTPAGELEFQTYFVQRRATDQVLSLRFEGAEHAAAAPGLIEAIREAAAVIVCPSNPFISIGPILSVAGVRDALRKTACVAAVSPIVGGRALKGPTADMMRSMGMRPSASEVARMYSDFVKVFVLDKADREQVAEVEALGMRPVVTNAIMRGVRERNALARTVVRDLGVEA